MAALVAALAAIVVLGVTAASASAGLLITPKFNKWIVTGSLTDKKLGQTINLPEGSTFSGSGELNVNAPTDITGTINGEVFVPPFTAKISLFGIPTEVGLTFTEVGPANGTIKSVAASNCPKPVAGTPETCVNLSVPTKVNLGITSLSLGAVKIPSQCETIEPVSFPLSTNLTLLEIITVGSHFSGNVNIPIVKCRGLFGFLLATDLTLLFSGPENPFTLNINPPPS
jgi:hypothetical protein